MSFASMTVTGLTWGAILPHGAANEFAGYKPGDAWAELRDTATAWDSLGYDHLWGSDHVMPAGPDRTGISFQPYTLLAAISQVSARARLAQVAVAPDGCCLDADGALWIADGRGGRAIRGCPDRAGYRGSPASSPTRRGIPLRLRPRHRGRPGRAARAAPPVTWWTRRSPGSARHGGRRCSPYR
jgi:hypothetical protein